MIVNESIYDILEKASNITLTNYDIKWFDAENISGYIKEENLIDIIEDLIIEVNRLEEEIEDIEEDIRDNYKRISNDEQIGISNGDFI